MFTRPLLRWPRQHPVQVVSDPPLTLDTLSPAEQDWFRVFKWERPASPSAMQHMMAQAFGAARAEELVIFFEKTAIPARPDEWRRRMH